MKDPNEYNVRAVERALQILRCFDGEHPERGISEIAQAVDLHKATAHRIVTTLVNYGYLERADDGQKYRLGLELTNLGFKVLQRLDLRREALPIMRQLTEEWDETCDLGIFDRGQVLYIEVVRGSRALNVAAAIGQTLPAHCTASGRALLAHLPDQEVNAVLSKPLTSYTTKTVTSPEEIRKELLTIRTQGYAVDMEGFELGVCAIAAPIFNSRGRIIAALGSPGPTSRMTPDRIRRMAASFGEAARTISHRMGHQE